MGSFEAIAMEESARMVQVRMVCFNCRPGADFLNAVGKYGNARYSV